MIIQWKPYHGNFVYYPFFPVVVLFSPVVYDYEYLVTTLKSLLAAPFVCKYELPFIIIREYWVLTSATFEITIILKHWWFRNYATFFGNLYSSYAYYILLWVDRTENYFGVYSDDNSVLQNEVSYDWTYIIFFTLLKIFVTNIQSK